MIRALSGVLPSQTFEPELHLGQFWLFCHQTFGTLWLGKIQSALRTSPSTLDAQQRSLRQRWPT